MIAVFAWPRLMDPEQTEAYVGGPTILEELKDVMKLKPKTNRRGLVRYDRHMVDAKIDGWQPQGDQE